MAIDVCVDNCVWEYLYANQIDLARELPQPEFCVCITREAEFEFPSDPAKRKFIDETIRKCGIKTDTIMGWADDRLSPDKQRVGGWGIGRWADTGELQFIEKQKKKKRGISSPRPTGLFKNEADISLAARSTNKISLTLENPTKSGPLKDASRAGMMVVTLINYDRDKMSIGDYIKKVIKEKNWQL